MLRTSGWEVGNVFLVPEKFPHTNINGVTPQSSPSFAWLPHFTSGGLYFLSKYPKSIT
jgi:hypothetical protein